MSKTTRQPLSSTVHHSLVCLSRNGECSRRRRLSRSHNGGRLSGWRPLSDTKSSVDGRTRGRRESGALSCSTSTLCFSLSSGSIPESGVSGTGGTNGERSPSHPQVGEGTIVRAREPSFAYSNLFCGPANLLIVLSSPLFLDLSTSTSPARPRHHGRRQ